MGNIIIEEDATPKPVPVNLIEEAVVLPGKPLTYDDLTPEQIEELQRPAKEAAETANKAAADANSAAQKAVTAAEIANSAASRANSASQTAISAAGTADTAATLAETAKDEANAAAQNAKDATNEANTAITNIKALGTELENKESEREASETLRKEAETKRAEAETNREQKFSQMETTITGLVEETTKAKDDATKAATSANEAAEKANTATTSANNAAKSANDAASAANQAAQNIDGRVTALEEKASEVYDNLEAIQNSGETNQNKIYIDGETAQPYIYKGGEFFPFKGEDKNEYYNENIYIPFYKCSLPTAHKKTEFAIPINGDLDDLFVLSYLNISSSQIRRVKNGKVIWEILQNIYIGMLYDHSVNNDVVFYGEYAFVRGRITGLAKINLNDGSVEFNKEVITEYENISLYEDYIIATGENKIVIIDPNTFSVYRQIDIEGKTYSINSYDDRVLISSGKNLYIIKDIDSDIIIISGSNIKKSYHIKYLINSTVDAYILYDSGKTRLITEDGSIDLISNEIFDTIGFSPQFVINNSAYAGNAIIYCICHNGYLTIRGSALSIGLLSKVSDFITYSRTEEIMKYFGEDYYIRRVGDIFYKVKIIGYAKN